jgi:DNA-binding transcriptional LysR family regulator
MNRMVDRLEDDLGAVLLNRSTRQVTLTDACGAYYLRSRDILNAMADADEPVSERG